MFAFLRPSIRRRAATRRQRRIRLDALESRDVPATHIDFVVDPSQSSLTLSGNVAGVDIKQQGAGSLTSSYSGTLAADVDFNANTIDISSTGTNLDAAVSGNWKPNVGGGSGTGPADYGGKVHITVIPFILEGDVFVAIRNTLANMSTSGAVPLNGTGAARTFDSTQALAIIGGTADYDANSLAQGSGTSDMSGNSGINASATASSLTDLGGGSFQLFVPVDLTINTTVSGQPATLHMVGQMTGNGSVPVLDLNGALGGNDATAGFTEDAAPAPIVAPDMTVTRAGGGTLTQATVSIANLLDGAAETLDVNLGASGLAKSYVNGVLTISGSASISAYQDVLRTVTYFNSSQAPTVTDRQVVFSVSAGTTTSFAQMSTVSVTPTEDQVVIDPINDQFTDEYVTLSLTATAFDPDLSPTNPIFSLDSPPPNASITADGQFTFTPDESQGGQVIPITVRATDAGATSATTTFQVTVANVNQAPVIPELADQPVDEGSPLSFFIGAVDSDTPSDTLTYSLVSPPSGAHIDSSTGEFTWDATDGPLTVPITVKVEDNGTPQMSDTKSFNVVVVSVAPNATFGNGGAVREDQAAQLSFTNPTDPASADTTAGFTYSFDLNNDGDFTDAGEVADSATPTLSAVFHNDGSHTIHGRITDKDGAARDITQTLTVTNIDLMVTAFDRGGLSTVRVLDATSLVEKFPPFLAYDAKFRGGVQVAVSDWNGDAVPDIITAPGPGGKDLKGTNHLKVFDGTTGAEITDAFVNSMPFGVKYARGYNLATGDFTHDGKVDLAVAPLGGLPNVIIIDGVTHDAHPALSVLPLLGAYKSGVRVAAGDVDGDGYPELIVAGGTAKKSLVRVLDVSGIQPVAVRPDMTPFLDHPKVRGKVNVAAGDLDGDGKADLIVSVMSGPPILRTFDGVTGAIVGTNELAQDAKYKGGLRVAALDITGDGKAEIITVTGKAAKLNAEIQRLDGTTFTLIDEKDVDPAKLFKGGAFVAVGR
jgi:Putative Ig domain/FG-GAP repeat